MTKFIIFLVVIFIGYEAYGYFQRQQLYTRIDTSSPTAQTYPREYLESFLKRGLDHCQYSKRYCEEQTLCSMNKMIAAYTYEQSNTIAATQDQTGTMAIGQMMLDCANKYADLR